MKRFAVIALAVILLASAFPALSSADPYRPHGRVVVQKARGGWYPPYPGGYYRGNGYSYNGWAIAGAAAGGLLLGALIASAATPRYTEPAPVYANPPSDYGPSTGYTGDNPPGQWVLVPGRWIAGKWVPAHREWIPVNP